MIFVSVKVEASRQSNWMGINSKFGLCKSDSSLEVLRRWGDPFSSLEGFTSSQKDLLEIYHKDKVDNKTKEAFNIENPHDDSEMYEGSVRRMSLFENVRSSFKFIVDVSPTLTSLLFQEDLDKDSRITLDDKGPKNYRLGTFDSEGHRTLEITGNYALSNLLQELSIAKDKNMSKIVLSGDNLTENPVSRLTRFIVQWFWPSLVRKFDINNLERMINDDKCPLSQEYYIKNKLDIFNEALEVKYQMITNLITFVDDNNEEALEIRDEMVDKKYPARYSHLIGRKFVIDEVKYMEFAKSHRIYVSRKDCIAYNYYIDACRNHPGLHMSVVSLPDRVDPKYIHFLRYFPGILSLGLRRKVKSDLCTENSIFHEDIRVGATSPGKYVAKQNEDIKRTEAVDNPKDSSQELVRKRKGESVLEELNDRDNVNDNNKITRNGSNLTDELEWMPYVVPGGRFNEMYGWDSYFICVGLLLSTSSLEDIPWPEKQGTELDFDKHPPGCYVESDISAHDFNLSYCPLGLCINLVSNFVYEINNYGMILNANRSYYLGRSQPPFLVRMIKDISRAWLKYLQNKYGEGRKDTSVREATHTIPDGKESSFHKEMESFMKWQAKSVVASIKEYTQVWMSEPRYVKEIGLSRYYNDRVGMPTETEKDHFDFTLKRYAVQYGLDLERFKEYYQKGFISVPELDMYFTHDGSIRESGHDTTYRFDHTVANLCTIDLNSLLYEYEIGISDILERYFEGGKTLVGYYPNIHIEIPTHEKFIDPLYWKEAAFKRKQLVNEYLWDEDKGFYYDYNIKKKERASYETVTAYWTLWSGLASLDQADSLVRRHIHKFEQPGGLSCGSFESLLISGSANKPKKQWDYPHGWPPHQIMTWMGLKKYIKILRKTKDISLMKRSHHYERILHRLMYKWCFMMSYSFANYNGVVPEKFDVVKGSHKTNVEYGNVGVDFKYFPKEGFGWTNSSYQYGIHNLPNKEKSALSALIPPDMLFNNDEQKLTMSDYGSLFEKESIIQEVDEDNCEDLE